MTYSEGPRKTNRKLIQVLTSPYFLGAACGSFAVVAIPNSKVASRCIEFLPEVVSRSSAAAILSIEPVRRSCLFAVGYGVGVLGKKYFDWLRIRALRRLLRYQEWIYGSPSLKNQIWGIIITMLSGFPPYSTFDFQDVLPKLPVPDLDQTLEKWLEVSKSFRSKSEHSETEDAVRTFRKNEGPKLQAYLKQRAAKMDNWLSDYWLYAAYLSGRESLMYHSNYITTNVIPRSTCSDQVVRAAVLAHVMAKYADVYFVKEIQPVMIQDRIPMCMSGFKYLVNTSRIPGEHVDTTRNFSDNPSCRYIIVIKNGLYFRVDMYASDPKQGKLTLLSTEELKIQLELISQEADRFGEKCSPVASLTAQKRPIWAKQRTRLEEQNKAILETIDRCMFIVSMDTEAPKDKTELLTLVTTGRGNNRWFDKCLTLVIFSNGMAGTNVEHSVLDAMVFSFMLCSTFEHEHYSNGDVVRDPDNPPRTLNPPHRLQWNVEGLEEDISKAMDSHCESASEVEYYAILCPYGKGFMKKCRLSPDGYIQMAIQLAYYRLHKETPKTYEPSTSMLYLKGRTETVHPISHWSVSWVKSMDDPSVGAVERKDLLKKAIRHQNNFRLDSTIGRGCDRHLLGLFCASRELGMDLPKIFMDEAWRTPFKLSTSQTPNKIYETVGDKADYPWCIGGFGPVCHDGYGVCYILYGDEIINICISSFTSCKETNSTKFGEEIRNAFEDLKILYSS